MESVSMASPDWSDKTILIGEDELVNLKLLEMILLKTQAKILHGNTGLEVLTIFNNNPDISLILMDIKMPVMDGIEATMEIRKRNRKIPIIAQTAYALEDEKLRCLNAGFNGYITKPINRKVMIELIQSLID
jgi:CheY-like chemotaxis protein